MQESDVCPGSEGDPAAVREEYENMERWLDAHPEFVHDYFARKAKRSMVDGWLISHAVSHSGLQLLSDSNSSGSNSKAGSKPSSGANTPVRKISAQEFDKGGILKPMVSTIDGMPTFLGPISDLDSPLKNSRRSKNEMKALDERELMYQLVMDICNDLDVTSLCLRILQNVCMLLNADRCSLFLVKSKGTDNKCLVSELFDVSVDCCMEDLKAKKAEIRVPWGTGIIGYVAMMGESLNIPDAYEDSRFNDAVDLRTGYKTRSMLSLPIKDSDGKVIGVAQAVNKISPEDEPFDEQDEKVFASYLAFCGIGLKNAQLYERSQLENKRNQVLLDLARVIFEEQSNVDSLIHKIMMHTQSLLRCERCQVLLVDESLKGIFSQVFDLSASDFDNDDSYNREGIHEPRFPVNIGITGFVAATGQTLNIPDAYEDSRFDPAVDAQSDFRTRSILCMPIKNAVGQVIGVSQLVNKLDGTTFNKNDENLFEAFSIFCGMGINNTKMYEKAIQAMARQRVAIEVMSYHAIAPVEEAERIKKMHIPSASHYRLLDYRFSDFALDDDDTLKACVRMFTDLNLLDRFRIKYEVLCRWLLSVKKNYRNVTYHNWRHAFNVAQTMFCMIKTGGMGQVLSDQEIVALMIGCLSHDLDHRGTNNQFQAKIMSPLAQLYSTSTMEHHHFDQCIMLLTAKGNEVFGNVSQEEREQVTQIIESAILATDLARYFRFRGHFLELIKSNPSWNCEHEKDLLRSMMMTACDVAAITKPWEVQKQVAVLIADEFFQQGDIEKEELNLKPQDMMDRDKKDQFPSMQVGFIDAICMPVYEAMAKVSRGMKPLWDGCQDNRNRWQALASREKMDTEQQHSEDKNKRRATTDNAENMDEG